MNLLQLWLAQLGAGATPLLPHPWLMHAGMVLGWAVVMPWAGVLLVWQCSLGTRRLVALALSVWALLPGPVSLSYWLGLAFNAPSITTLLVCAALLQEDLLPRGADHGLQRLHRTRRKVRYGPELWASVAGLVLGYFMFLDTFAVFPVSLYAWGFSPLCMAVVMVLVLLPLLGRRALEQGRLWKLCLLPATVLLFVVTRLPSGNLWDALLDPLLWISLHLVVLRSVSRR